MPLLAVRGVHGEAQRLQDAGNPDKRPHVVRPALETDE